MRNIARRALSFERYPITAPITVARAICHETVRATLATLKYLRATHTKFALDSVEPGLHAGSGKCHRKYFGGARRHAR